MRRKKRKRRSYKGLFLILLMGIGWISYDWYFEDVIKEQIYQIPFEEELVNIDSFTRYGQYFNIEGVLEVDAKDVSDVKVVLKKYEEDLEYDTIFNIENDSIYFSTNEKINEGINLDNIEINKYAVVLKVRFNDEIIKYYGMINNTNYEEIDYYTLTDNGDNNHIEINFKEGIPYFEMNIKKSDLPDAIYDIVIDPGHGGIDPGAVNGNIHESDIVLDFSLELKEALEKEGYKVKLTRETDINPGNGVIDPYDEGRVIIPNDVKAKYLLSIHLNSDSSPVKIGGVEVYGCPNSDLTLAQSFADNIVNYAGTNYSVNNKYKVSDGVYVRSFFQSEIDSMEEEALEAGYEPYTISSNTPYYYMLRETGGIITEAYVDGRNTVYSSNKYYDSNYGPESYILELGYIINDNDLYNVQNNADGYIKGIISTFP